MRRLVQIMIVVALTAFLLHTAPVAAQDKERAFDHAGVARQALERFIRPGYERLAAATRALDQSLAAHCGSATASTRAAVDTAFDGVVEAWGRVEGLSFGPVAAQQRLERIMFWPDRRGIGARQLATALRTLDPSVVDATTLADKSVAIQGLPALDALLFGEPDGATVPLDARRHRCAFASAVASNLAAMARSIAAEWAASDGYARSWLAPGPGNPHYLKPSETTLALSKALDLGIERVRDQRLGGPLGMTPQRRRIPAPLARSGRSMRLVAAGIAGLRDLYVEGGLERALLAAAQAENGSSTPVLARLVATELATALDGAAGLVATRSPFEDAASVQRIIALGYPLKNARLTASTLLADEAGLPLGFNASDGD